jgi:uncharacterized protein YacL
MLLWLTRGAFASLMLCVSLVALSLGLSDSTTVVPSVIGAVAILGVAGLVLLMDLREKEKSVSTVSSIFFGLILGLIVGWLVGNVVQSLIVSAAQPNAGPDGSLNSRSIDRIISITKVVINLVCCYLAVSLLMQTRNDFRFIIPYVEFAKQIKGGKPLVLDTSVIIDGRIADLCETRIIDTRIIVPKFILQELQSVADSSDKMKRNRGRRGLDILKKLQTNPKIDLQMHEGNAGELKPGEKMKVDERLVAFTKLLGGRVVTNDFNLNKIAQLQGVDVINLNEVSNSLKTLALPGDFLSIKVVKPGEQHGQGIGYLDDGTMVVVEQGKNMIGQDVSIVVTSVLQTNAGRMIFGRPEARTSGAFVPVGMSGTHDPLKVDGKAGTSGTDLPKPG